MNSQKVEPASLWYHDNCERVEAEQLLSDAGMIPEMFIVRTSKMCFANNWLTSLRWTFFFNEVLQ